MTTTIERRCGAAAPVRRAATADAARSARPGVLQIPWLSRWVFLTRLLISRTLRLCSVCSVHLLPLLSPPPDIRECHPLALFPAPQLQALRAFLDAQKAGLRDSPARGVEPDVRSGLSRQLSIQRQPSVSAPSSHPLSSLRHHDPHSPHQHHPQQPDFAEAASPAEPAPVLGSVVESLPGRRVGTGRTRLSFVADAAAALLGPVLVPDHSVLPGTGAGAAHAVAAPATSPLSARPARASLRGSGGPLPPLLDVLAAASNGFPASSPAIASSKRGSVRLVAVQAAPAPSAAASTAVGPPRAGRRSMAEDDVALLGGSPTDGWAVRVALESGMGASDIGIADLPAVAAAVTHQTLLRSHSAEAAEAAATRAAGAHHRAAADASAGAGVSGGATAVQPALSLLTAADIGLDDVDSGLAQLRVEEHLLAQGPREGETMGFKSTAAAMAFLLAEGPEDELDQVAAVMADRRETPSPSSHFVAATAVDHGGVRARASADQSLYERSVARAAGREALRAQFGANPHAPARALTAAEENDSPASAAPSRGAERHGAPDQHSSGPAETRTGRPSARAGGVALGRAGVALGGAKAADALATFTTMGPRRPDLHTPKAPYVPPGAAAAALAAATARASPRPRPLLPQTSAAALATMSGGGRLAGAGAGIVSAVASGVEATSAAPRVKQLSFEAT